MAAFAQVDMLVGLLALAALCAFLSAKTKLSAALAPLAALALIEGYLLCAGLLGVLQGALYAGYVLCAVLGVYAMQLLRKRGTMRAQLARLPLGALAFWGAAVAFLVYFAFVQPCFTIFDEYSFWGTAAKQTALYGKLYVECPIGTPWQATEFTALALLSYWMQGFGAFAAWKVIFATNVLLLAGLCAVVSCAQGDLVCAKPLRAQSLRCTFPVLFVALLTPTFFTVYSHTAAPSDVWLTVLGDIPSGVLFGGSVAFWLSLRRSGARGAQRFYIIPVLCLAANIKTNTFVLALAAAGTIAADVLLFGAQVGERTCEQPCRSARAVAVLRRGGFALMCLLAPMMQYAVWSSYAAARVAEHASNGGYGATSEPLSAVVRGGIGVLLGMPVSEYYAARAEAFRAYAQSMWALFYTRELSMVGTGAAVVLLILLLFALACVLVKGWRAKFRVVCVAACTSVCFALYSFMLLLSYAFILKDSSPAQPASYARYFGSYYLGWFCIALAVLAAACAAAQRAARLRSLCARGVLVVLALFVFAKSVCYLEPQYSVLGVSKGEFIEAQTAQTVVDAVQATIAPDESVFLVDDGDDGYRWFMYSQLLLPYRLEYGTGGADYGLAEYQGDAIYYCAYTADEFSAAVRESGAAYVLVLQANEAFTQSYQALFGDALASTAQGAALYRVDEIGFHPVPFAVQVGGDA